MFIKLQTSGQPQTGFYKNKQFNLPVRRFLRIIHRQKTQFHRGNFYNPESFHNFAPVILTDCFNQREEKVKEKENDKKSFEVGSRIIDAGFTLFRAYGIRAVTLDEIALQLGISKKTIYENFSGKDDLVTQIVEGRLKLMRQQSEEIREKAANAIEVCIKTSENLNTVFRNMNPLLVMDLQKFHPKAYQFYHEHMYGFVLKNITAMLNRGIEEGLFNNKMDVAIMARYRVESCLLCFAPGTFPKDRFEMSRVQTALMEHFLRGIATDKGLKIIKKYQKNKD